MTPVSRVRVRQGFPNSNPRPYPEPTHDPNPRVLQPRGIPYEFWYRDPVECVRELIGKPAFDGYLKYAPKQHFADAAGEVEVINEMWTARW